MKTVSAIAALACIVAAGTAGAQAAPASGPGWQVAGNLGMMQFVVVDEARARQRALYDEAIAALCPLQVTCFLRFFTNSTGAPLGVPLADAILGEPAAMYQRSAKQRNEVFQWSCRLGMPEGNCF